MIRFSSPSDLTQGVRYSIPAYARRPTLAGKPRNENNDVAPAFIGELVGLADSHA